MLGIIYLLWRKIIKTMIIYSVQCIVKADSAAAWEKYFVEEHLDDVLNSGCFTAYTFKEELSESGEEVLFISDYFCPSQEVLDKYNQEFAPALKQDVIEKFGGKFTATRKLYRLVRRK